MQLFTSPNSPYARKCRIVIAEKALTGIEEISVVPADNDPRLLAVNPLGSVPALVTDAGLHLCESPIICEYLDGLPSTAPKLIHDDVGDQLCILSLAAMGDGIMDAAVTCVMENRRPADKQHAPVVERKEKALLRTIEKIASVGLDVHLPLTMGTLNLVVALEYVSFRLPHLNWKTLHPELAAFAETIGARPSFATTQPA